jgi:Yip1-like protein
MPTPPEGNSFLQRLIGAAALDAAIYEEVEADSGALGQAMTVVVLSSLSVGFGATGFGGSLTAIPFFAIVSLMSWAAWALVTFEIGSRLMAAPETRVSLGQLLRTIGFAATPGMISALGFMPGLTIPVFIVASVWMLMAMVVAVRQALDSSTARAIAVCVLGWVLAIGMSVVLGLLFAPTVS